MSTCEAAALVLLKWRGCLVTVRIAFLLCLPAVIQARVHPLASASHLDPGLLLTDHRLTRPSHALLTRMLQLARHRVAVQLFARAAPCRLIASAVASGRLPSSTPSWKEPARGGQDLARRYERLEKSLRGKELYQQEIGDLVEEADPLQSVAVARKRRNTAKTFMGFVVPQEPRPPGPDGACLSHMMRMQRCDPFYFSP